MEYLDIYNEKGEMLGVKKTRQEVHNTGLWHKVVYVWIVNLRHEILMQKRSPLKKDYPNMWDISVGGHVSAGDDNLTSAQSEVEEEIGLKIDRKDLIHIGSTKTMNKRVGYINNEIKTIYLIKKDVETKSLKKQDEEVSEIKFISYKELRTIIERSDPTFVKHPEEYKLLFEFLEADK
jgi:isopentenyl-diphosphate delta-isomerase